MTPLVSIIMPACDVGPYIGEAIESVLNQSCENWQLIIVENACRDNTSKVISEFSDKRILHVKTDIPGLSHARNIGLSLAEGDYVCFLDADDRLPRDSIIGRANVLNTSSDTMFVDGSVVTFSLDWKNILRKWKPSFRGVPLQEMCRLNPSCFCGITWMIRNTVDLHFDEAWTHLEDRVFFLSIAGRGNYEFVEDEIYHIRRRPGSLMTNHRELERAFESFLKRVESEKVLSKREMKKEIHAYYRMFLRTYLKSKNWKGIVRCGWNYLLTF